jgi:hypothetical protein
MENLMNLKTMMQGRVLAGIALLDERNPGWREKVSPEKLDFYRRNQDILGLIYGDYEKGLQKLDIETKLGKRQYVAVGGEATKYGFHTGEISGSPHYWALTDALQEVWQEQLSQKSVPA